MSMRWRSGVGDLRHVAVLVALSGCGSSTALSSRTADGGRERPADEPVLPTDAASSPADAALLADSNVPSEVSKSSDDGTLADASGEVQAGDGGAPDVPSVCQSPFGFQAASQTPSMCPGAVLKDAALPFDPNDARWAALYSSCIATGEKFACGKLCTAVASSSLKYIEGISWCGLDCSQPRSPVLTLTYSDFMCELPPLDVGQPIPPRLDAGIDAGVDVPAAADSGEAGSGAQVTLRLLSVWANCKRPPPVPNDPILVSWTADVSGASGNSADFVMGTLGIVNGAATITQSFTVDTPTIALVAGAGSANQWKSAGSYSPNAACNQMCGGMASYRLDLVYAIDGQSVLVSNSGVFICEY